MMYSISLFKDERSSVEFYYETLEEVFERVTDFISQGFDVYISEKEED